MLVVAKMSDTVFFSLVIFLGSYWGTEPLSIPVTEGLENNFSSSSNHLEENMAKLFDEIVLQVFPSNLDGARTAGRLITGRDVNGTYLHHNGISNSEFVSSSHMQDENLAKIFDEILWQVLSNDSNSLSKEDARAAPDSLPWTDTNENENLLQVLSNDSKYLSKEDARTSPEPLIWTDTNENEILWQVLSNDSNYFSEEDARTAAEPLPWTDTYETHIAENEEPSLFDRDVSHQLTVGENESLQENTRGASRDGLPCSQLLSFLQKNIISATTATVAILLSMVLVVCTLVICIRRRQPKFPPANMTYNIFIMNGKSLWQNSQDKHLKKFIGKQKHLKYNSPV